MIFVTGVVRAYSLSKNGSVALSKNFKVREFKCKDGSDVIFVADDLVDVLQRVRDHFGKAVTINSAYRTPAYNKKVGGAQYSQHLYGYAADIVVVGVTPQKVYDFLDGLLAKTGGLGLYKNFVHVDVRTTKTRFKGAY